MSKKINREHNCDIEVTAGNIRIKAKTRNGATSSMFIYASDSSSVYCNVSDLDDLIDAAVTIKKELLTPPDLSRDIDMTSLISNNKGLTNKPVKITFWERICAYFEKK